MNKKRFLLTSACSLLMLTAVVGFNKERAQKVFALEDLVVDMSSYSVIDDKDGGTIVAPYNGIAIVTKAVASGKTVDVSVPVDTSGNIAIEMKNFTKNGVNVSITLKKGEESFPLTDTSKTYTVSKKEGLAREVTGTEIALPTDGTQTNGLEAFNGFVVVPNDQAIDSVVISIPLDAAEKVFIGGIYRVEGDIAADAQVQISGQRPLYTPSAINFTATNTDYAYVEYLTKNTTVIGGACSDNWEQSRVTLPNLQQDGTFKLDDYKYLVMDVDFSERESVTKLGFEFFRNNSSKYNADRVNPKVVHAFAEDGTYTTSTIGLGAVHTLPAGFKGKLYYELAEDNLVFGANWNSDPYTGYVFKQMMMYFAAGQNGSNIDKPYTFNMYFTNSDYIQTGETPYLLTTDVNDKARGNVSIDLTSGIKVTPTPNTDYVIGSVLVNGQPVELTDGHLQYESLDENKKVVVNFVGSKVINYSCENPNVTIQSDLETIHNGDDVTFNFAVGGAFSIKSIKANGVDIALDLNGNYSVKNITEDIVFDVETIKAEKVSVDSNNLVLINEYAGGTVWAPFDGVALVSKALVGGEKATLEFPADINGKYVAIKVTNLNRGTNTKLDVTLKKGEEEYTRTEESKYYLYDDGIMTEKTGKEIALNGSGTAAGGYYGFNGYVLIPNDQLIDSVSISVDLTYSQKLFFGEIYAVESSASYVFDETTLKYSPAADNYEVEVNEESAYVNYLTKNTYLVVGPHTGSDGWEQSRVLLDGLEVDGTFDISKWSYLVMEVDFSERNDRTRIGFEFFRNDGNKYNADRANPAKVVAIGDNGSYYTEESALGTAWYIPAHFKGKLYFSLAEDNMLYGTNFKETDSKTALFKEMMLYALCQNNQGNKGVMSSLDIYFTSEALPEYEYVNLTISVNDTNKGSAAFDTYTQVIKGSDSTVVVTPKVGYLIDTILVNGQEVEFTGNEYVISNIQADISVEVAFVNDPTMPKFAWTVTEEDEHVEVVCENQLIPFGTDAKFYFYPDFGYVVKLVTINGVEVELIDNSYTLKQVEEEVTITVESEVIPPLTETKYGTELANSFGSSILEINALNNFYAKYDSVFVSGILYSRDTAKEICPQPYVGIDLVGLSTTDLSSMDLLLVQYQHYHTQSASSTGTGIKLCLIDANGKEIAVSTGAKFYLIDNKLDENSKGYTVASAYVSGGMIFTPFDFSGYLAIPKAAFTSGGPDALNEGFDFTNVSAIKIFTDYRWWSDSGSRYAIGDVYLGTHNPETLAITGYNKIWSGKDGTYNEYLGAYNGESQPYTATEVSFSDFAFTERFEAGRLYFFDYTHDFSKYTKKGYSFNLSKEMATNGFYDFRDVNIIRFIVDNTGNDAIAFDLSFTANNYTWRLSNFARIVTYNLDTNEAEYNLREIPANFRGYVDIYFAPEAFICDIEDAEFSEWLDAKIKLSLPECSSSGIANGTSLAFDCNILTDSYELEYQTIKARMFNIRYELNGGTNASGNPAEYAALSEVQLLPATKEGYEFVGWYQTADFSGNPITSFAGATGDITLYAKFSAHFTITYTIGENGDVRPRREEVDAGDSLTILIFPDDGYDVASVKVNGKAVALDENDSFVIEDIQEDIVIEVIFMVDPDQQPETSEPASEEPSIEPSVQPSTPAEETSKQEGGKKKGCRGAAGTGLVSLIALCGVIVLKRKHK